MPWYQKPWYSYLPKRKDSHPKALCKTCHHSKLEHYVKVEKVKGRKRLGCALCIRETDCGCALGKPKKKKQK